MTGPEQTEKARRTKAEKHALNEVLKALQEIVGEELAGSTDPTVGAGDGPRGVPGPEPELPELVDEVQGDLWHEDIPVLHHVVVAPEHPASPVIALTAAEARAIVGRAVHVFNARRGEADRLTPPALELLEHLLFEEWMHHVNRNADPDHAGGGNTKA